MEFDEDESDDEGNDSSGSVQEDNALEEISVAEEFLKFSTPLLLDEVVTADVKFARAANFFMHEVGFDNVFMVEGGPSKREIRRTLDNVVLRLHEAQSKFHRLLDMIKH